MKIDDTTGAAALFALQQALQQPKNLLSILTQTAATGGQSLETSQQDTNVQNASASNDEKGTIIDTII